MPSAEAALAVGLVAVYLVDSFDWLPSGEAVLEWHGPREARLRFGSRMTLAGRRPALPRPWWPGVGFRLAWTLGAARPLDWAAAAARARALRPIAIASALDAVLVAVVAPAALLAGANLVFVAAVALAVAVTLVNGAVAFARRRALGVGTAETLGTVLVALLCLPCGGNLARALARHGRLPVSLPEALAGAPSAVRTRLAADAAREFRAVRDDEPPDSPLAPRLAAAVARLEELAR
jgi:hypothetical protein